MFRPDRMRPGWDPRDHHRSGGWFQVHQILPSFPVLPQSHPAQELVMHAITLFGNLQSFMGQALDQAVATQALWHSLSSRLRVSVGLWDSQGRKGGCPILDVRLCWVV